MFSTNFSLVHSLFGFGSSLKTLFRPWFTLVPYLLGLGSPLEHPLFGLGSSLMAMCQTCTILVRWCLAMFLGRVPLSHIFFGKGHVQALFPLKLLIIKLLIKDGSCFLLEIAHVLVKIGLARQMGWICCYSELGSLAPQNPLTEKLPNMMIDANFELITIKFITEWFHHLQTTHNMPNPLRLNTVCHSHNHSKSLWQLSSATSSSSRPASPPINITRCGGCCLRTKCNSVNLS